jgi:nucleotide-binding universal stress UspA family protein
MPVISAPRPCACTCPDSVVRRRAGTRFAVLALAVASAGVAGCGLGPGPGTSNISLTVTRQFGTRALGTVTEVRVPGSETVMRMLERSFRVQTRFGGGFVQSINGHSGDSARHDWFYYVNGIEASQGAAGTAVHRGDRIWWDLHDWTVTDSVPAVVGSFPEPFLHGSGGKRLPTAVGCAPDAAAACSRVAANLKAVGVPVASQLLGSGSGTDSLAVLVGTWRDMRGVIAADLIAEGPTGSGVYARFAGTGGSSLQLLDPRGRVAETLGAGAGLIAATRDQISEPTWLITGTDLAGVSAAANALTPARLRDHFALAVEGGSDLPVPEQAVR